MYCIDGCVSSPLIQYMYKSVQSSFVNCSINTVYSCTLKMVGKRLKKYFLNRRPATGLRGVRLLHDNASSHKAAIVREYLKQEKVVELQHPPYHQILPRVNFSYSRGSKNTSLEENNKCAKILVRLFFGV